MKDLQRVLPALLGLLLLAGGCVAPSPPPVPSAAAGPTSAQAGGQTIVAIAPPATPPQTLPQWLGINDLFTGVGGGLHQAKHQLFGALFPQLSTALAGLEPPPALKSLTDPANLGPGAPPGVKDIAEVKADEDAAPQKIAAIKYAATIGCVKGHPGIERAFLQFLDDPTEAVRYEAAKALAEMIGTPCETCPKGSCCTPAIYKKLTEIVTKEKSPGCYVEYSDRVRRMARLAITNCGPPPPTPAKVGPGPIEGPGKPPLPKKEKIEGPVEPPPAPGIAAAKRSEVGGRRSEVSGQRSAESGGSSDLKSPTSDLSALERDTPRDTLQKSAFATSGVPAETPSRRVLMVQWERVSVPFANFTSHKEAFNAIGYLRARVLGARLLRSPGFKKDQVSVQTFDWTDLNTVSPSVLARTLKSLPVGQVSPILKDRQGYHLVRVLQRQYRHVSPDGKTTQPPATAEPAVPGPILQTGGVGNALPAKNAPRRSPKEQWPPDLGTLQLQPQPQPQPQPPRSFPVVNENEDRPPLPEPVPERVAPIAQPSAKQPETKQAAPSATQQPAPTIIDTRSDEPSPAGASPFAPLKRRGFGERKTTNSDSAADFSSGTSTPPAKPDWRDFGGIEPFPADSKTPAETARRRPMPNEAAAQPADGDIFGEEMNPRRQAVAPAKNNMKTDTKSDTPPPAAGRYRLPKKQQPTQELTPVWVPGMENQTSRDSGPSRRRIQPRRDDVPRRRPARTPPSRAVEWDAPSHPTPTGGTARFEATRSPVEARQQNVPVVRPTSRAATPANVTAGPPWSSIDRRAATRVPESPQPARIAPQQFVEPAEPARLPAKTIPARTVPEKAQPAQSESPRPRRRGNVYIQSGRRSPVREISVGDRTSTVRTPNALVPKLELGNERQAKPKSTPQRPVAKLRRQRPARSTLPNAAQNRNRTADSIRFVPVDSLRKRNRKSGETAGASERTSARHGRSTPAILDGGVAGAPSRPATVERKSPSDPSRKQKPLYFSRSGQRSMDYESELDSERE